MEQEKIFQTSCLKDWLEIIIREKFGDREERRDEVACKRSSYFYKAFLGKIKEAEPKHPSEANLQLRDTGLELYNGH